MAGACRTRVGQGVERGQNTRGGTPSAPPTTPSSRTLSRPMWMRSLVRNTLGLKEDELKAFFIRASARRKQHGQSAHCSKGLASGQTASARPQASPAEKTASTREGLPLLAVTSWSFSDLASQVKWGPRTAGVQMK